MKYFILLLFCFPILGFKYSTPTFGLIEKTEFKFVDTIPGNFSDDYGIKYTITDSLWLQHPSSRYHILRWDKEKQYIIAKNDAQNKSDAGLYTRIDYMKFAGMEPYTWGFCLSVYNATTDSIAEFGPNKTNRSNPRKGCNGFPFSRMKKSE